MSISLQKVIKTFESVYQWFLIIPKRDIKRCFSEKGGGKER